MASRFKFKLEPVLRLKELKEEEVKSKLGRIVSEINKKSELILEYKDEINTYFDQYENAETNKGEMVGALRQYMPEFLISHYEKIKKCQREIEELYKNRDNLIQDLNKAKGQVKIFSNLKDRKFNEYLLKKKKKLNSELEDLMVIKGENK